jgi:transposase
VASHATPSHLLLQTDLRLASPQQLHQPYQQLLRGYEKYPDATLWEYCEYFGETYDKWVSNSTMCRSLKKQQLTLKKNVTQ